MKPRDLTVRCMAWRENDLWVAVCIDFTLAAQGATLKEARAGLHTQIASYVSEALSTDAAHAEQLLSRKAPIQHRLRFAFWSWIDSLRKARAAKQRAYIEPLPLMAA